MNNHALWKMSFGVKKRISFYKKLKSYTEQEFPVYDTLTKFKKRFDKKKDTRGKIIGVWLRNMKYGASLAQSMKGWIPESELNLIAAGESGTGLEKGLDQAINFATKTKLIKNTIIKGALYPLFLMIVVLAAIMMFSLKLAPIYTQILPIERWPSLAYNFYYVSKFLVDWWMILLAIVLSAGFLISKTIGIFTGPIREKVFDKIPPWSVYKVYQSCVFLISLSSLMQSGVPLNDALKKLQINSSRWLTKYLSKMQANMLKGGSNFGNHLNVGLLDEETSLDVIDYSELGNFESAVAEIGDQNLEESVVRIEASMKILQNLALLCIGVVVGLIYYVNVDLNNVIADSATRMR